MKKFVVLYHMPADAMKDSGEKSPEEMKKAMEPWMEWAKRCGDGLVDLGAPLGNGKHVDQSGSADSDKDVAGYSILQAESMDDALDMLKDHPHNNWNAACSIEVFETMPLPGQDA